MPILGIQEASPCEVACLFEGGDAYAKLKKEDFEKILRGCRSVVLSCEPLIMTVMYTAIFKDLFILHYTDFYQETLVIQHITASVGHCRKRSFDSFPPLGFDSSLIH